ncbi:ABC transporter permease [Celeribacter indicus]|uniref:Binding-protein-dependent transporters inner membrane component n=1 Tax=Celeribacter indicus TaxID=1208324 RepID=A0A0B5DW35_9RHOB|nr:ABC transporter permease [Celeribacter indicus]AJE47588.1 binding-protein-dependent transporters inner membrane component [Celeribacter indicus]SDW11128.1 NitT/TauT family transport system permease protein [Celeribacter indicus]
MTSVPDHSPRIRSDVLRRIGEIVPPALWTLLILVIFWQAIVTLRNIPEYILPAPSQIAGEIGSYWHRLLPNALVTLSEIALGYTLAVLIAVPLAVAIVYSRVMQRAVYPLIVLSQTVPKVAVAPLLLTWFGYGMTPKIVIVIMMSFFPIVINSVMGLRATTPEMLYLAKSMGANGWQIFWKFRLPKALPSVFAGLRLATVLSVIGAIIAEFIGADRGLGYLILIAGANFDIARQFAAIILITVMGMSFFGIISWLERRMIPWQEQSELGGKG